MTDMSTSVTEWPAGRCGNDDSGERHGGHSGTRTLYLVVSTGEPSIDRDVTSTVTNPEGDAPLSPREFHCRYIWKSAVFLKSMYRCPPSNSTLETYSGRSGMFHTEFAFGEKNVMPKLPGLSTSWPFLPTGSRSVSWIANMSEYSGYSRSWALASSCSMREPRWMKNEYVSLRVAI